VAVTEPHEAAKTHDRVGHASGQLVDDEVVDLTDIPVIGSIDRGSMDVFARNALMVWMNSCACHGLFLLAMRFCLFNSMATRMFLNHHRNWTHGRCAIFLDREVPASAAFLGREKRMPPRALDPPAMNLFRDVEFFSVIETQDLWSANSSRLLQFFAHCSLLLVQLL
jgi:hypothetical protein